MKSINILTFKGRRTAAVPGAVAALLTLALAATGHSAQVTLTTGNGVGTSGFNGPTGWSSGAAPTVGSDYTVAVQFLRTPPDAVSYTFVGDSLSLNAGGGMIYKGTGTAAILTINNFILNGGFIRSGSSFADVMHIAGGLTVNGTGSSILADQSAFVFDSVLTGTGALATQSAGGGFNITFNGASTYTGNLTASTTQAAARTILSGTSHWKFLIGASGVNNTITGAGNITFDGTFDIDLSTAGNTVGNSWNLVNVSTLVETFGATFNIPGFTENNNVWTSTSGKYQFSETTGVLSRITADTDGDGLPDAWEEQYFGVGNLFEEPGGDYDNDFCSNLLEYQRGTDPTNAASYPDTDTDGLNDGWEMFFFNGSLAETAAGDPDGDYNSNAVEFAAGTSPSSADSYPDTEDFGSGDGMNDGWEIHFFGSIATLPDADPDGDLFTNYQEFLAKTDPTVQISSPDNDGDGLPDGWEVKYFRVGAGDLDSTIALQDGTGDPDGDLYNNLAEFKANTNPTLASSAPSSLAYWRFEERTTGVVPVGNDTGGNQTNTVLDSSGLGNHMMTWRSYTSPLYSTVVPFATVPLTAAANTASLNFVRDGANLFVTDNVYTTTGVELNSHVFSAFTIEASFNTNATNVWQVVVGKTGNPIGGQAPFSLKIRATDNKLIAGIVDGAGTAKEAVSTRAITTGTWFSAVVTASATEMKLWIKGATDTNYILEATTTISGAFYTYAGVNAPWVVGLGKWNGADADPFGGYIDEIRISPKVLAPAEFLIPVTTNDTDNDGMDDTWETTAFGGLGQTDTGDFDGDGTSNLTEYRLGLTANSGSSLFKITRGANGLLTWPSVTGVKFDVLRSTSLAAGSWTIISPVAGIDGAAGNSSFTDPAPPAGNAFYRVALRP
ncbi:MAG: LamG-like jellyroll fold domain-containing protein [Luteolibacter sp.]|uniref:LamG-like jellyroll fold domain-containing protein n=1 Tax=Luteolibacter sp. TaxID=1962973 RepID=UPI0032634DAE